MPDPMASPASTSQQRLWFLHRLDSTSPVYNLPRVWRIAGSLDVRALDRAISTIIERHEPLRTNCILTEGRLIQVVAARTSSGLCVTDLTDNADSEQELARIIEEDVAKPFDLERDLMIRCRLVRLRENEHVLIVVLHHMATDLWSSFVFDRELGCLYASFSKGESPVLQPLAASYREYAAQERAYLETPAAQRALSFWTAHLANTPLLLDLPHDRARLPMQGHRGRQHCFTIPAELVAGLRRISQQARVTLMTTLLAAFEVLLFRLSQQSSFVVGVPAWGRSQAAFEVLIGNFVNTLAIRGDLSGDPTFRDLLKRVNATVLNALDHQGAPFDAVIDALRPERSLSRGPVFQVMFNFTSGKIESFQADTLVIERLAVHNQSSLEDLILALSLNERGLNGTFEYDVDLFDASTIARFAERFLVLLGSVIGGLDLPVARLAWIPECERRVLWPNGAGSPFPEERPLHQLIEERARCTPDTVAVACDGSVLQYQELDERANRVAKHLRDLGAREGARVAIAMERSIDLVVGLLGILKAGAAYVPVSLSQPHARMQAIMDDADPVLLLTHGSVGGSLRIAGPRTVLIEDAIRQGGANPLPRTVDSSAPAYLIYTSGTTGEPKGVVVSHRAVVNVLESFRNRPGFGETDVLLAITPLSFDIAGLEIFLPLYAGARLEIATSDVATDPVRLAEKLVACGATVMQATPATWRMLLESGWSGGGQLRAWCGGEALPRDLADRLLPRAQELWNLYGPTETTIWSAAHRVEAGVGSVSIGTPLANTQLYVVDIHAQRVPIGVPGELYIGGVGLADGYWRQPERTAEKFLPDPFQPGGRVYKTGDLVRYLPSGELVWLQRTDTQVKLRGHRIELGEIEACLRQHPSVAAALAVLRDDGTANSSLVAYLLPKRGSVIDPADLRAWALARLPDYMSPSRFVALETLPLTANGKVDRMSLPEVEKSNAFTRGSYTGPRDSVEQRLSKIWMELLKVDQVDVRDDYFELGGNSMVAVLLFLRIEKEFGHKLPLTTLFRASSLESLAAEIRRASATDSSGSLVPMRTEGDRSPLFLVSRLHGLGYSALVNHLPPDRPVYGLQPPGLDGSGNILSRVEDLAAFYIERIRSVQAAGPYCIGGYSFGGFVAYEIAQQLELSGEPVSLLVLVDAEASALPRYLGSLSLTRRTGLKADRGMQTMRHHWNAARSGGRKKASKYWVDLVKRELRLHRELRQEVWDADPNASQLTQRVDQANRHAFHEYLPRPYEGRGVLFRSTEGMRPRDPSSGWGALLRGGVLTFDIQGSAHLNILNRVHAPLVAEILKKQMEEAEARPRLRLPPAEETPRNAAQ
jgi:amino acid adenylation domain-containing protein